MARRKRIHPSLIIVEAVAAAIQVCEWPGCLEHGEYKAPKSRDLLREYRWFCMEHIRAYNKRWNYFEGMSEEEVEADLRRDTVWQRPSWPLGDREEGDIKGPKPGMGTFGIDPDYFVDSFGLFDEKESANGAQDVDAPTRKALAIFGLAMPITAEMLKGKYKELVKKHHPDTNGGTKEAEEKFKEILDAYETLRHFLVV